jgi:hypothetical protein
MVLLINVAYRHDALKGIVHVDHNYMDGQWRLDESGHRYWYYYRPGLRFNMDTPHRMDGETMITNNTIKGSSPSGRGQEHH